MTLSPAPEDVVARIVAVVRGGWPEVGDDRPDYLARLDLVEVGETDEREPGYVSGSLRTTDLEAPIEGEWSTWKGDLFSFNWFLYHQRGDAGPLAREGFAAIRTLLTVELGDPAEEWGPVNEPAALWLAQGSSVELYCHQRGSSVVQVGPGHVARNRDFEARTTRPPRPS